MEATHKRLEDLRLHTDPVLSELAKKYVNTGFVSNKIIMDVPVTKSTGKFPIFGTENFRIFDTSRPLRASVKEMPTDTISEDSFATVQHALSVMLDEREIFEARDLFDLERYQTEVLMDSMLLKKEALAVDLLTSTTSYASGHVSALTTGSTFDVATVDPITVLQDAMETVRNKTLQMPNIIILGYPTFKAIINNPLVTARIKSVSADLVNEDRIASWLSTKLSNVEVVVGQGAYQDSQTGEFVDLWQDVAVIAYNKTVTNGSRTKYDQSFGKCFVKSNMPIIVKEPRDYGMNVGIAAKMEFIHKITDNNAGYLITNTVA